MKKTVGVSIVVIVGLGAFCILFSMIKPDYSTSVRHYQHEINAEADSSIGITTIDVDGTVKDDFVTHLPIVVLDTQGEEIPNIYTFAGENQDRYFADNSMTNPWIGVTMSIIDNENHVNKISDEPELLNQGLIKLRGASSRAFQKKQYGIKLLDDAQSELELPVLGMDADEDWVLSNSILDASCIRNYMAYNIGGQIFPYTPEARFCEVIIKNGDTYDYRGLYLLTESVKRGKGRVDIEKFDSKANRLSFLICRDRYDYTKTTLSTWASDSQLCYGWFTIKYPNEEVLTEQVISRMEEELSTIEKVIYSENQEEFLTYSQYIDVDSFVDYFVVNEFFMNYDSGNNSTYYYQDSAHKLSMGPLWDYDNCWDNYKLAAGDAQFIVFTMRPWFEKLVQDPAFVNKVCERYGELRKTILSEQYLNDFIDDTVQYLGNAAMRDRSRWREAYEEEHMLAVTTEGQGYTIDRNRNNYDDEIIRLKDMAFEHGIWLDEYMDDFLSEYVVEDMDARETVVYSVIAIVFVIGFIIMVILINRKARE